MIINNPVIKNNFELFFYYACYHIFNYSDNIEYIIKFLLNDVFVIVNSHFLIHIYLC